MKHHKKHFVQEQFAEDETKVRQAALFNILQYLTVITGALQEYLNDLE
jgi:hypothetical protein